MIGKPIVVILVLAELASLDRSKHEHMAHTHNEQYGHQITRLIQGSQQETIGSTSVKRGVWRSV